MNNGGSPRGVKDPPILATKNIKKTMIWVLFFLHLLARIKGLISNIAAPVVPIHEANKVPINRKNKFNFGVPTKFPLKTIPPEIVNKANKRTIKGIYSKNIA